MIKTAGTGYTLTYIGQDSQQVPFAFTTSPSFDVLVGPVYMTAFSKFVGTAAGGMPFLPNPVIVAVDKGGNLVSSVNGYTVTAFLSMSPTGKEKLKPEHLLTVQFFNGIATFQQLYINESGSPYQVAFSSNMVRISIFD